VAARLVSLLVVMWGSLRVTREDPSSGAPHGRSGSRWVARLCFFRSEMGACERQRVLRHEQVGEQSPGALTDVFGVVARYREMPSYP
jgi:hypothetical protein